jgi:site-specific recombinase XerD
MNLSAQFKTYLLNQKQPASKATVKNYLSDLNRFIAWFEAKYAHNFTAGEVSPETLVTFKNESLALRSASSVERNLSSLRKFFTYASLEGITTRSPFEANDRIEELDPWRILDFKNFLFVVHSSPLTIKNYIIDVKQFKSWLEETIPLTDRTQVNISQLIYDIDSSLFSEYKSRLLKNLSLSPVSVNRKLSSLRRYISWAKEQGIIKNDKEVLILNEPQAFIPLVIPTPTAKTQEIINPAVTYSKFPPFRFIQKSKIGAIIIFDTILIAPLALLFTKLDTIAWIAKGKPVFESRIIKSPIASILDPLQKPTGPVKNIPKSFYAPTKISVTQLPIHRQIYHKARYSRPEWYRKYHSYTFVSYLHFSILMLTVILFGYLIFLNSDSKAKNEAVLATPPVVPNRILSFQGRITDESGVPVDSGANLRMAIYESQDASGSALLWQEVVFAAPDTDGIFNVILGQNTVIPQSLFAENPALWLGVAVENTPELEPRQPIATVAYAVNAETIQGLVPITNSINNANVLLALNSSGNLTIGGTASHTFTVAGGNFTLTGQTLILSSNTGSNGNIILNPDGSGIVDIQKTIQNTSNNNDIIPGSVQVDDILVINDSSTNLALLNINQGSTGDLIIASVSSSTKFLVDNAGNISSGGSFNGLNISGGTISNGTWNGAIIGSAHGGTGLNTSSSTGFPYISSGTWNLDSGNLDPARGGTGLDTSSLTGVPFISAGTWNVNTDGLAPNYGGTGISTYNTGDILYADNTNNLTTLSIGGNGNCLISDGNIPSWGSCSGTNDLLWTENIGTIFPVNSTQDLLIGGQSTGSAKFAVLNTNGARGTQTASISGSITLDSSSSRIQTTNRQPLTIGGDSTGNIQVENINGAVFTTFDTVNSSIGIGTSFPEAGLHVTRPLSYSATGKALVILNQTENQDIFTASASGVPQFTITSNGNITFSGNFTPDSSGLYNFGVADTARLAEIYTESLNATKTDAYGDLRLGRDDTSIADQDYLGQIKFFGKTTGGAWQEGAGIYGRSIGNEASAVPTFMEFWTTPSGGSLTRRWIITENGNLDPGTSSTYDIGGDGERVRKIYVDTINTTFATANNAALCWDNSGDSDITDCAGGPSADYAEMYPTVSDVEYRDIVEVGNELVDTYDNDGNKVDWDKVIGQIGRAKKATNNRRIIGIVSNNYNDFSSTGYNIREKDRPMPVALSGRVPVKVTSENGNILIGDPITISSIAGVGMKATKANRIIGFALGNYSNQNPGEIGEVMIFINPGYHDPDIYLTSSGNLRLNVDPKTSLGIVTNNGQDVNRISAFTESFIGNLFAGLIEAKKITTDSLNVTTGNVTIDGNSLDEYIAEISSKQQSGITKQEIKNLIQEELAFYGNFDLNTSTESAQVGQMIISANPDEDNTIIIYTDSLIGLEFSNKNEANYDNNFIILTQVSTLTKNLIENLKAGYLELGRLTVTSAKIAFASFGEITTEALAVSTQNLTIAGVSINDYISNIVDERISQRQITISYPILETDLIKPANGNDIAIKLPTNDIHSKLEIVNASGSAVASIDAEGNISAQGDLNAQNASFSGQLSSSGLNTNQARLDSVTARQASISGTLRTGRLIADSLELSGDALSSLQNSIASAPAIVNNYYYNNPEEEDKIARSSATGSATLASITADYGIFMNGFTSFGDTSFYDVSIANRLFVGTQLSIAEKSINVLGSDLKIQSLGQGGVDFLNGKIVIDTKGDLNVNGNASFAKNVDINGKLSAGIISPLPGKGLVFEFDQNTSSDQVEFRSGSGSAVLSFNSQGDIQSSGSGTFSKLNLNIIPEALAVNETEVIATGSAGTAQINPYKNELTINNTQVTKDSLIYITPKTNVSNQNIYILRQTEGKSFTVGISKIISKPVSFNWIIIN